MACSLFSIRPDWEAVGFVGNARLSVLTQDLVTKALVPSQLVVSMVPVGAFDSCMQKTGEHVYVDALFALM